MDPFQGLASFILGKMKDSTVGLWWKLIFEMVFSGVVSFLTVCGSLLASGVRYSVAIGTGMVTAAVALTYLFRKETSRLTKGMLVVLPSLEANKELNTDLQSIQKEK